ncbi:MAG: hypothetical protein ACI815_000791 [Psychroserpens sp.]|jgi:hypothetical protein
MGNYNNPIAYYLYVIARAQTPQGPKLEIPVINYL